MPPNESNSTNQSTSNSGDRPAMNSSPTDVDLKPSKKNPLMMVIVVLLLILIGVGIYAIAKNHNKTTSSTTTSPTIVQISITKTGFVPASVSVNVGEPVIWTNNDTDPHQVASDPYPTDNALLSLNSQSPLSNGQAFSYIFNKSGTYTYHDNLNPYTIKGTVVVK